MSIKIIKHGDDLDDLYIVEVAASNGTWRSPPLPNDELGRELLSLGYDPVEIRHALLDAGVGDFGYQVREATKKIGPLLQAALAGERKVPPQRPLTEAWLAYALPRSDKMLSLIEIVRSAEWINDSVPSPDEVSWAFLRLKKRGWLVKEGEVYGLTPEARSAIIEIEDDNSRWPSKLVEWMSEHPLPGDE